MCKEKIPAEVLQVFNGHARSWQIALQHKKKIKFESVDDHKYVLLVVEEYSSYTAVFPLHTKRKTSDVVLTYVKKIETLAGRDIVAVHTDGGLEFSRALTALEKDGVNLSTTTPYSPSRNGLAERTHGVIIESAHSCILEVKLLQFY